MKSHKEKEVRNRKGAEEGGRRRESEIGIKGIKEIPSNYFSVHYPLPSLLPTSAVF